MGLVEFLLDAPAPEVVEPAAPVEDETGEDGPVEEEPAETEPESEGEQTEKST